MNKRSENKARSRKEKHNMSFTYSELKVGDSESFSKTITSADILLFAAVSGDMNQLHINEEFGKTTRFGNRMGHVI